MKNLLISALIVGSLACPIAANAHVGRTKSKGPEEHNTMRQQMIERENPGHHHKHGSKKCNKKHVKKRMHKKRVKSGYSSEVDTSSHGSQGNQPSPVPVTPAERKIDKETELNNR